MIVNQTESIPELHGIIFIDCWEQAGSQENQKTLEKFYNNIVQQTQGYNFSWCVNASTGLALDINDPSINNTFSLYSWTQRPQETLYVRTRRDQLMATICQYSHRQTGLEPLTTSKIIQKKFFDAHRAILILDGLDLVFHNDWKCQKKCKNWLVVGQQWQYCVHENSMGLNQFSKLINEFDLNFYATDYSFLKENGDCANHQDFADDSLEWSVVPGLGYKLMPNNPGHDFPFLRYKYFHA